MLHLNYSYVKNVLGVKTVKVLDKDWKGILHWNTCIFQMRSL
jgi:hypothetical protein